MSAVSRAIGGNVAELIPNGATLQMGIGEIPNAVLAALKDQARPRDPHGDVLRRRRRPGRERRDHRRAQDAPPRQARPTFVWARKRPYDFVDDNPSVEMPPDRLRERPVRRSPRTDRMVAINSALAVDLTGQVCADSIGPRLYSGVRRSARLHPRRRAVGRAAGRSSRCRRRRRAAGLAHRRRCSPRARASSRRRADVHDVVTEYGVARLHGRACASGRRS